MRVPLLTAPRIVAFTLIYLGLAWLLVILVDGQNLFGLSDALQDSVLEDEPLVWYHLFREASPTEMLQWVMLGTGVILAARLSGVLSSASYRDAAIFFTVIAAGMFLMLLEDTGNPRHHFWLYARHYMEDQRTLFEFFFFGPIAFVMVYAIFRYWRYPFASGHATLFFVLGFVFYAVAVTSSAMHQEADFYERAGNFWHNLLADGDMVRPDGWSDFLFHFWLMDFLVEESIELLGASSLLAGIVAYGHDFDREPAIGDGYESTPTPAGED